MHANSQGYSLQHVRNNLPSNTCSFPTIFNGKFAQAMSSITRNQNCGIPGRVVTTHLDDDFKTEVSQALAIKLDLKIHQNAHKKMIQKLISPVVAVLPLSWHCRLGLRYTER